MNTPATPDWEKEFDEKFPPADPADIGKDDRFKSFIRTLLTQSRLQYRQELVEKATKLRKSSEDGRYKGEGERWLNGYDCAFYDFLALLKD